VTTAGPAAATAKAAERNSRVPVLVSVNVGMPRNVPWQGKTVFTGVWKHPVRGPVMVRRLNIDGVAWFKACSAVQAFEPRLSATLFAQWPDRVAEVLAHDQERAWLLLADAGTPIGMVGNPPQAWLVALPLYAELQRSEATHTHDHLAHGVPDLRLATLPARYEDLLRRDLPLGRDEIGRLREFAPRFAALCGQLTAHDVPETVQHDDLHMANVYTRGGRLRLLDWGDASVSHPFASLVVTFRFLEQRSKLPPGDPWFGRLRDAYLEPWGHGLAGVFALAIRVGVFAHTFAWAAARPPSAAGRSPVRQGVRDRAAARGRSDARIGRHALRRIHPGRALCNQLSRPARLPRRATPYGRSKSIAAHHCAGQQHEREPPA
jgi:MOSC domain-containing protein YiiM